MTEWVIRDPRRPEMVMHPSTEGALLAVKSLSETQEFHNILDIGCGSGLLSMIAAQHWPKARITAADISEQAVLDATENIHRGGLESHIQVVRADGYDHPLIEECAPYDLILCNLLGELLIRFSPALKHSLSSEGTAVLSGILAWIQPQVVLAHEALGFAVTAKIARAEWRTLILHQA